MSVTSRVGQPMLAAMFISGGTDQLLHPEEKAEVAADLTEEVEAQLDEQLPLRDDPATMVRINGAVQVAAGALLVLNKAPRLAAAALAGSLVPTTLGAHRFWEIEDEDDRRQQQIHFLKNLAMLGGLVMTMGHRDGRPSLSWRAKRAVRRRSSGVSDSVADTLVSAADTLSTAGEAAGARAADVADRTTHAASKVTDRAGVALADARPRIESTAADAGERARSAWRTALPVVRRLRDDAADLAQQSITRGRKAYQHATT